MSRQIEEQNYLDFVRLNIVLKGEEITELLDSSAIGGAGPKSGRAIAEKLRNRKENLPNSNEPYFVRIDLKSGETLYYGFSTLTKAKSSPAVPDTHPGVDEWLTYSRVNDGHGWTVLPISDFDDVIRRTRFQIKNGKLIKFEEESNDHIQVEPVPDKVLAREQLIETMSEARTESLKPVGATLQADQFLITREAAGIPLVIQGPPGSGKTVVLLERLARIAFADKTTKEKGMLLIGPNQHFLEYVKEALDILGSSEVILSTPEELTNWKFTENPDAEVIKSIKGFSSFTKIVDNYFSQLPSILDSGYNLKLADIDVHFSVIDSLNLIELYRHDVGSYQQLRLRASSSISNLLVERFFQIWESRGKQRNQFDGDPLKLVQSNSTFRTILRNIYPEVTAESVLKALKKSPKTFLDCSSRVLTEEQKMLWLEHVTEFDYEIREADVAILDYIDFKIRGNEENWGHIAIDEAQDLTPMQFLMLKRRVYNFNSITLSGDLAQATGAMFYETWSEITDYFSNQEAKYSELSRSYRVPAEILEYANRHLKNTLAKVSAAEPFLEIPGSFEAHYPIDRNDQLNYAEWLADETLSENQSVLIVGNKDCKDYFNKKFQNLESGKHFKAYLAEDVKGLEYDVVILVDPVGIISDLNYSDDRLARLFYVISTRSTKKLHVIGSSELEIYDPINASKVDPSSDEFLPEVKIIRSEEENHRISDSIDEITNEIDSIFQLGSKSIPKLCEKFGMAVNTSDPSMLTNDWFYLGMTNQPCIACGYRQQQVFRKHFVNSRGQISHPGAFVCLSCLVARNGEEFESSYLSRVDDEMHFKSQLLTLCLDCSNV